MENLTQAEKYRFKRKLEELEDVKGQHTELISLYIPPDKQISDVMAQLRDEYSQSSNIKSKQTRKNVLAAIESIMSQLRYFKSPPPNGMVFLVGEGARKGKQPKMISEVVEPPLPISIYLYRCDSSFFLDPLQEMLEEKDCYGLLLIDRRECTIGFLFGKRIDMAAYMTSRVPGKHGRGGQSQRRFERLTEIAAHEWFKKAGEKATDLFLEKENLKGVLVGGPGPTKREFLNGNYLDYRIQGNIVGIYDTGYTDEYGLKELVNTAADDLEEMDIIREKRVMNRFMSELRSDSGLAVYGEDEVKRALTIGAVDTLVLSDELRKYRVKVSCPECGYSGHQIVKDPDSEIACPECGTVTTIEEVKDMLEEYADMAQQVSTDVQIISSETEEGSILLTAFGGVAGILRYRIR
ncbi:MAG: peptide chain release factor aRF-1 [Candidatus Thermoplasmatota archaeon]|nr:peptide chain release factor aRF-1 [Candidatus Thermoplasmatota archaeon]